MKDLLKIPLALKPGAFVRSLSTADPNHIG